MENVTLPEINDNDKPAERRPFTCLVLNDVIYVPHYTNAGYYVAPGHKQSRHSKTNEVIFESECIPESKLFDAGARCVKELLWVTPARKETDSPTRMASFKQFSEA
jgi:hypothetical protein